MKVMARVKLARASERAVRVAERVAWTSVPLLVAFVIWLLVEWVKLRGE